MKRASLVAGPEQAASPLTAARSTAVALWLILATGCATWERPVDSSAESLRARAVSTTARDVRVSAAVLSAEDSRRMLGANVVETGVQPVWIEVQNNSPEWLYLLRSGIDPDYFSSLEVAWSLHATFAGETNARIDDHFKAQEFVNPIPSGATRSGIVFTNPQPRTRVLNVDLVGGGHLLPFSIFLPVPDSVGDARLGRFREQYADMQATDYLDASLLRAALERLPCCATDGSGATPGDPLNVLMVGEFDDVAAAVTRRGFRRDSREFDDAQQVFGRPPDFILRKYAQGGAPATWVRLWLAPLRFQGSPIFLGQVGRARGGRFVTTDVENLTLHPDVDEARNLLIQDMTYSGGLAKLGFAQGVGAAPVAAPRIALGGASYHTDGLRAVLFLATRPLALGELEILDWANYLEQQEADAASATNGEQE
jgi:hypothetical protein